MVAKLNEATAVTVLSVSMVKTPPVRSNFSRVTAINIEISLP